MPIRWAVANGNWSDTNTWNSGSVLGIPTGSDDVWSNTFNVNIDQSFDVVTLRNTVRARDIATPAMTANNAPSPFVAAASSTTDSTQPFQVFDRNYNTTTFWSSNPAPQWLSMDFGSGSAIIIDGYTIYGNNDQTLNPRNWALQGSNNNTSWTDLHIVSGAAAIAASSTYSVASIGNSTGYRYYRVNVSLGGGGTRLRITELELYQPGTITLSSGGSFIFNSGSITGSVTSTTRGLFAGATNLVQVTATTGSVTLNLSSNATAVAQGNLILHSGNCNFNLNGFNFSGANLNLATCITKTSSGTITIVGNLIAAQAGGQSGNNALTSTSGNTVVIGNVVGGGGNANQGINQSVGNLTVIGNITGGTNGSSTGVTLSGVSSQLTVVGNVTGGTTTNAFGISFSGTSGSVTGNVTGGTNASAHGISTSGLVTVTGNVTGNTANGINTSNTVNITGNVTAGGNGRGVGISSATPNLTVNVTGTVTATSTGLGIAIGGGTGNQVVNLSGNMINVGGKQAIYSQNLFISNTTTSQWRLFTPGSQNKTLYSADTFPNLPSSTNVRSGSVYGILDTLSGSMVVPSPSDVRINVPVDNTVGTGTSLTAADFLNEISSSNNAVAQRLRNIATDDTVGSLLTGFNKGGF
jgi:hypothetical protein